MKLETETNKNIYGKKDQKYPVAATLDGEIVAVGETAVDAKERAMVQLADAWKHRSDFPAVSVAKDGSIFVVVYTGDNSYFAEHIELDPVNGSKHNRCGHSGSLGKHYSGDGEYWLHNTANVAEYYRQWWNRTLDEIEAHKAKEATAV